MNIGNDEPGLNRFIDSACEPKERFWFEFGFNERRRRNKENLRLRREGAVIGNEIVMMKRERVGEL